MNQRLRYCILHPSAFILSLRISGRDQAKLGIQDADQVVEVPGTVRVPRCIEQFLAGSHLSLDVSAGLGKQGFQHRLGGFLVESMLGRGGRSAEGLFQEGRSEPFDSTDLRERGWRPGLPFHHLGEESQPHGDDLPVLGQARDGLIQESVLVPGNIVRRSGKSP